MHARTRARALRLRRRRGRRAAFTLVELLTVVAIISLLVGMVVPTLSAILQATYKLQTKIRLKNLDDGAQMYRMRATGNKYFPGQQILSELRGGGGQYGGRGSYLLGACLFTDANGTERVTAYGVYEDGILDDANGTFSKGVGYSVLDAYPDPMPVLYCPADTTQSGADQYPRTVNALYLVDEYVPTGFNNTMWDDSVAVEGVSFVEGRFLLKSAGKDRLYCTGDDINNWN